MTLQGLLTFAAAAGIGALLTRFLPARERSRGGGVGTAQRGRLRSTAVELERAFVLASAGYKSRLGDLRPLVPVGAGVEGRLTLSCWTKDGRCYLNDPGARHLRDAVAKRWRAHTAGKALFPVDSPLLTQVEIRRRVPRWRPNACLVVTLRHFDKVGRKEELRIEANDDGLFDVTDHGIVNAPSARPDLYGL
jgi:hypothetical protein